MEFLGIGYQELLLVLVLLLVVVGPERLPGMAYQLGKAVRTMQRYARAVRDEFREEIDYLDEQVKTVRGELDTARVALKEQEREFRSEMRALDEAAKVSLPPLIPSTNGTTPANGTADSATPVVPAMNGSHSHEPATPPAEPEKKPEESGKKPLVF